MGYGERHDHAVSLVQREGAASAGRPDGNNRFCSGLFSYARIRVDGHSPVLIPLCK